MSNSLSVNLIILPGKYCLENKDIMTKPRVLLIGGGPAGLMAAGSAAQHGADAMLLEKGPRVARKLLITGKGRCNLTNSAPIREFIDAFGNKGKFLHGVFSRFFREDLLEILLSEGVECKEERGGRIFPTSDKAQDVAEAVEHWMIKSGAKIKTGCRALSVLVDSGQATGLKVMGGEIRAGAVIIATGGLSYPKTGSNGEGYNMAREMGHTISELRPALAPLLTREKWISEIMGLSLKNVNARLICTGPSGREKIVCEEFGEMLFTHFGVSGPIILTLSREVPDSLANGATFISIDLKPALTEDQLHLRLIRDFKQTIHFRNYLKSLLPNLLAQLFPKLTEIDPDKPLHRITADERKRIVTLLKDFRLGVKAMGPIDEAIVTAGGVVLGEVDSKTMMSKIVPGVFFAGEVLDLDAKTGGYNLQAAFSTGYIAGQCAAEYALKTI